MPNILREANKRIAINEIKIGKRHRRDIGSTVELMLSMQKVGLLHPIVLDRNHNLVSGYRRLEVAKLLEWDTIPFVVAESVVDAFSHLTAERDENTCRKDFTPLEKVAMGKALEEIERPKARERQAAAGPAEGSGKKSGSVKFTEPLRKGQTRDIVAAALGVSGPTYDRMKKVADAAEEDPETFGEIAAEMDRTGSARGALAKVEAIKRGDSPDGEASSKCHGQ